MAPAAVTPYNNLATFQSYWLLPALRKSMARCSPMRSCRMDCSVHVRGSVTGSLTIELGADVLVDGSVYGKIINRGGRLVVKHKGLTACSVREGPPESDVGATLKINLTAIGFNWESLAKSTDADCAAVLECNAYGCGIDRVADALAKSGCRTSLSPILPRLGRVRTAAPNAIIYVLHGLHAGAPRGFAELNAQPVINSAIELAEWDAFVSSNGWSGGCALNVDTGENRLGLSMAEAAHLSGQGRLFESWHHASDEHFGSAEQADDPQSERQIAWFSELRRLYRGIPASLAGASAILLQSEISLRSRARRLGAVRDKPDSRFGESDASCRRAMRTHRACPRHDARAKLHRCRTKAASPRLGLDRARRRLSAVMASQDQAARHRWRVPLSRDRALVVGSARDRHHRFARCQGWIDRRNGNADRLRPSPSTRSPRRRNRPAGRCSPLSATASIASTTQPESLEPKQRKARSAQCSENPKTITINFLPPCNSLNGRQLHRQSRRSRHRWRSPHRPISVHHRPRRDCGRQNCWRGDGASIGPDRGRTSGIDHFDKRRRKSGRRGCRGGVDDRRIGQGHHSRKPR